MPPTKSSELVDDWAEISQNAIRLGTAINLDPNYESTLCIDIGLSNATAHTGTKIEIHVSSNSSGNVDWTTLTSFIGPIGTANLEVLGGTEAIGQTVLEVASTTGYEADGGRWIFLEDTGNVANSEMLYLVSHVANTSITVLNGLTVAKDSADQLSNIAKNYVIALPSSARRVRVVYDNTFDSDGATVHTRCRLNKITAV